MISMLRAIQAMKLVVTEKDPVLCVNLVRQRLKLRGVIHTINDIGQQATMKRKYHANLPSHISGPVDPRISLPTTDLA